MQVRGVSAIEIVREKGLEQISDPQVLEPADPRDLLQNREQVQFKEETIECLVFCGASHEADSGSGESSLVNRILLEKMKA